MSKTMKRVHTLALYTLMPCTLALAVWLFPLRGQSRLASDTPGVSLSTPYELLHRTPVEFQNKSGSGQVVVSVSLNDSGEVSDARIVSGPSELRASVLRSVLGWHFNPQSAALREFEVTVRFDASASKR